MEYYNTILFVGSGKGDFDIEYANYFSTIILAFYGIKFQAMISVKTA